MDGKTRKFLQFCGKSEGIAVLFFEKCANKGAKIGKSCLLFAEIFAIFYNIFLIGNILTHQFNGVFFKNVNKCEHFRARVCEARVQGLIFFAAIKRRKNTDQNQSDKRPIYQIAHLHLGGNFKSLIGNLKPFAEHMIS